MCQAYSMEKVHKELLRDYSVELQTQIGWSVKCVINYLHSKRIISSVMVDELLSRRTDADKVFALLDLLKRSGNKAFKTFYDATCYYQLWGAADILHPERSPHENLAAALPAAQPHPPVEDVNNLQIGPSSFQLRLMVYNQVLRQESQPNPGRQHQVYPNPSPRMGQPYPSQQHLQYNCHNDDNQVAVLDCPASDAPKKTLPECQGLISQFRTPVNINDIITLAALERIADLDESERKACNRVTCMAMKAKEYLEELVRKLMNDERMTAEGAKNKYVKNISLSQTPMASQGCMFFQVWGLSPPALLGPNILQISKWEIKFLDIATKKPKDNLQWPFNSLNEYKRSNDYTYSVILEFHDNNMLTLLSLEYEEICKELDRLNDENTGRCGF